jgi:hypothetical protein
MIGHNSSATLEYRVKIAGYLDRNGTPLNGQSNLHLYTSYCIIMSRPISLFSSSLRASSSLRRPISALPRAPIRFLATPSTGPQTVSSGPIKTPHPLDASTKTNKDEGSRHGGEQTPGSAAAVKATQAWPDYSKGPSALDKVNCSSLQRLSGVSRLSRRSASEKRLSTIERVILTNRNVDRA